MNLRHIYHRTFAPLVLRIIEASSRSEDERVKKKLLEACICVIQKMTDYPPDMISLKAKGVVKAAGMNPGELLWKDRLKFKRESGRSAIVFEHVQPITAFVKSLLDMTSSEDVIQAILQYPGVCIITREEDDLLMRSGFKSLRPDGWEATYSNCQIEVLKL